MGSNGGDIVWEWRSWDHLVQDYDSTKLNYGVISENPGKFDLNVVKTPDHDWLHVNGISYNEELDQIVIGSPYLDEIWIIDHSTTTEEAATNAGGNSGKGGDILYRWGNPENYDRGTETDRQLFGQHNPTWLKEDNEWKISLFNNGNTQPEGFISSIEIIKLPIENDGSYILDNSSSYGPLLPEFTHLLTAPELYAAFISGVQKLPNGNLLICSGTSGNLTEINPENDQVWHYIQPMGIGGFVGCPDDTEAVSGFVFRAEKYPRDYPGLQDLSDLGVWGQSNCPLNVKSNKSMVNWVYSYDQIEVSSPIRIKTLELVNMSGQMLIEKNSPSETHLLNVGSLVPGIYIIKVALENGDTDYRKYLIN